MQILTILTVFTNSAACLIPLSSGFILSLSLTKKQKFSLSYLTTILFAQNETMSDLIFQNLELIEKDATMKKTLRNIDHKNEEVRTF